MRIEVKGHLPWAVGSIALVGACGYLYIGYAKAAAEGPLGGPSGSTPYGITLGILAAICMAFAGVLGLRRRYRSRRLGSGRFWLRMHLWLGTISLPLVWFHAGFRYGEMLTTIIMILLYAVWITGVFGIILQQFMPAHLKGKVPNETLFSQIGKTIDAMREEAARLAENGGPIAELYKATVKPFLLTPATSSGLMAVSGACQQTKSKVDAKTSASVDGLAKICGDYRTLLAEKRLLFLLHSWLLIHVPLSMALLLLSAIHIIMALRLTF